MQGCRRRAIKLNPYRLRSSQTLCRVLAARLLSFPSRELDLALFGSSHRLADETKFGSIDATKRECRWHSPTDRSSSRLRTARQPVNCGNGLVRLNSCAQPSVSSIGSCCEWPREPALVRALGGSAPRAAEQQLLSCDRARSRKSDSRAPTAYAQSVRMRVRVRVRVKERQRRGQRRRDRDRSPAVAQEANGGVLPF